MSALASNGPATPSIANNARVFELPLGLAFMESAFRWFMRRCPRKEDQSQSAHSIGDVMTGIDPAIQTTSFRCWMPGSRPGMTIAHDAPPSPASNEILNYQPKPKPTKGKGVG